MIHFQKAIITDCEEIHNMQIKAFTELLEKYNDINTNPACESLDTIRNKMNFSNYYFILNDTIKVGVIRIINNDGKCRISPMFILPEYQNKGYAQSSLILAERLYPNIRHWSLDTIKQEEKLCHLYSKMGYIPTGKETDIQDGMTIIFFEKNV